MQKIRAITLDLDDTLWPIEPVIASAELALFEWLAQHCPRTVAQRDVDSLRQQRMDFAAHNPQWHHDLTTLRMKFLRRLLTENDYDPQLAVEAFGVFIRQRNKVTAYPDVDPVLRQLAARFPLASVSNGNADLTVIGLNVYFTAEVTASRVGVAKPHRDVFLAACDAVGESPTHVVHIGDHPTQDVLGAAQVGMRTIWVNRNRTPWQHAHQADAEVSSLHEVPALLAIGN